MTYPDGSVPTHTFTSGTTAQSAQVNANFAEIASLLNGNLLNAHINAAASIALTKLNKTTEFQVLRAAAAACVGAGTTGDTVSRIQMSADGELEFGAGSASAVDIMIKRASSSVLAIRNVADNADKGLTASTLTLSGAFTPSTVTLGVVYYGDGTNQVALTGNTTTTQKFLAQTGNGSVSAAPGWVTLAAADLPATAAKTDNNNNFTAAQLPNATNSYDLGSTSKWWRDLYLGTGTTSYFKVNGTATGARTVSLPDSDSTTVIGTTATSNQFLTHITTGGVQTKAQPAFSNLSGTITVAQGGLALTSATAGDIIYASAADTWAKLAKGTALQVLRMNSGATAPEWATAASAFNGTCNFRLSLTSGTSVTTSNVTAATTIYLTPHNGCRIDLYDGSAWSTLTSAEVSASLAGLTANLPYDVFAYNNSGTLTLELLAWTNSTTRATAIAYQDGVPSKTGALTRRLVGTILITASTGQCEDSDSFRGVSNVYNQQPRLLKCTDSTNSWTYNSTTYRPFNNSTTLGTGKIAWVTALANQRMSLIAIQCPYLDTAGDAANIAIGIDSTSTSSGSTLSSTYAGGTMITNQQAIYIGFPAVGSHAAYPLESAAVGTITLYGDNGATTPLSGLFGEVLM